MKTKRITIVVLFISFVLACCLSCNQEPQHKHTFSTMWSYDSSSHWHAATCGHDVVAEKATHVFENNGKCNVCGYESIEYMFDITSEGSLSVKSGYKDKLPKELIIPSEVAGIKVNSIFEYAFQDCASLTSITFPDSVKVVGYDAFSGCNGITDVYASNLSSWCNILFQNRYANPMCYAENLYIGGELISGSVELPSGIIGLYSTFINCKDITSVTIPDSVVIISGAFEGCSGITDITIPNSVIYLFNSFVGCTGLTNITIPNSVTYIGVCAFENCTGLSSITIPDSVTSIGSEAFYGCSGLSSITIGNSVTRIERLAFSRCTRLSSITIPDSVTSIGDGAFIVCSGLTSITIGNSVTSIGEGTFELDTGLTNITIPDSVTSIGKMAFYGCSGLSSITIPDSVTSIGAHAFDGCTGLTSITIPASVTSIGSEAFYGCSGLSSITIPDSVTSISLGTFKGCIRLTSITIPDSVTSIDSEAFYNCTSLYNVTIPSSVTTIGESAFYNCHHLQNVYVSDLSSWCNISFANDTSSPMYYAKHLYVDGSLLSGTVEIPSDVTGIPIAALAWCDEITSIVIPDSVLDIGKYAFYGCTCLSSITFTGTKTQWDSITKMDYWNYNVPATVVHCSDGDVSL